jgi:hypothetical protein
MFVLILKLRRGAVDSSPLELRRARDEKFVVCFDIKAPKGRSIEAQAGRPGLRVIMPSALKGRSS